MTSETDDLDVALQAYHEALEAFVQGKPAPLESVYSPRSDATIANPFGPPVRGWPDVAEAFRRAAANYRDGAAQGFEQISKFVTPELAYTVEIERYRAKVGGSAEMTPVSVRVTTVLRREDEEWKVVHRHADPITASRSAESVVEQ